MPRLGRAGSPDRLGCPGGRRWRPAHGLAAWPRAAAQLAEAALALSRQLLELEQLLLDVVAGRSPSSPFISLSDRRAGQRGSPSSAAAARGSAASCAAVVESRATGVGPQHADLGPAYLLHLRRCRHQAASPGEARCGDDAISLRRNEVGAAGRDVNWSFRFCAHAASCRPGLTGRSSPYDTTSRSPAVDALVDEVPLRRGGAAVAQREVVLVGAALVAVAGDLDSRCRVRRQDRRLAIEGRPGRPA